jgi:hypothetical protein
MKSGLIKFLILLFLPQVTMANWNEISCDSLFKGKDLSQMQVKKIKVGSKLTVQVTYRPSQGCGFEIDSKSKKRRYNFIDDELTYLPMKNNGVPHGVKSFVTYPKVEKLKLYKDPTSGDLKVKQVNGSEIFFSAQSGEIDSRKTTDFKIEQTKFNDSTGGLTLTNPKHSLITFNFQRGYGAKSNLNTNATIEQSGYSCTIPASTLFNFKYTCDNPTHAKRYCDLPKNELLSKMRDRYNNISKSSGSTNFNKFLTNSVDGVSLKSTSTQKINQLLAKEGLCPKLTGKRPKDSLPIEQGIKKKIKADKPKKKKTKIPPLAKSSNHKMRKVNGRTSNKKTPHPMPSKKEIGPKVIAKINRDKKARPSTEIKGTKTTEVKPITTEAIKKNNDKRLECLEKLNEYFSKSHNQDEINEYLRIQAKISLHRIAWVTMKTSETNTKNIEASILDLLKTRKPELHKSFLEKDLKTRNERLLSVMNELKISSTSFNSPKNIPYQIKYSDVKMMELLVETEEQFGRSNATGARDFISIIKNSMQDRLGDKTENIKHFQTIINQLLSKAKVIETKLENFLMQSDCKNESDLISCGRSDKQLDISELLANSNEVINHFYSAQFERNKELNNNFKWSAKDKDYWLHVK